MKTRDEISEKISSMVSSVRELAKRSKELASQGDRTSKEVIEELKTMRNQILEIYNNTQTLRWVLGEISDTDLIINSSSNIIEILNNEECNPDNSQ